MVSVGAYKPELFRKGWENHASGDSSVAGIVQFTGNLGICGLQTVGVCYLRVSPISTDRAAKYPAAIPDPNWSGQLIVALWALQIEGLVGGWENGVHGDGIALRIPPLGCLRNDPREIVEMRWTPSSAIRTAGDLISLFDDIVAGGFQTVQFVWRMCPGDIADGASKLIVLS